MLTIILNVTTMRMRIHIYTDGYKKKAATALSALLLYTIHNLRLVHLMHNNYKKVAYRIVKCTKNWFLKF